MYTFTGSLQYGGSLGGTPVCHPQTGSNPHLQEEDTLRYNRPVLLTTSLINSVHVDQTTNGWLFTCINIIYVVINGCVWAAVQPLGYSLKFVSWNTGRKREMVRPGCNGHGFRTSLSDHSMLSSSHRTTGIYA